MQFDFEMMPFKVPKLEGTHEWTDLYKFSFEELFVLAVNANVVYDSVTHCLKASDSKLLSVLRENE